MVSFYPWLELILLICFGAKVIWDYLLFLSFNGEQIKTEGGAKVTANKTGIYKR